jgi:hypothetical protein
MKALKVVLLCFFVAVIAFIALGIYASSTPEGQARAQDRAAIDLCRKHLADPEIPENSKRMIIAPTCKRFEEEFRRKWNLEP